jgi:transcriptional antiterminator Rof (Rho-off)
VELFGKKKRRRKGCQYKLEIKRETQEGEKTNAQARTVRN